MKKKLTNKRLVAYLMSHKHIDMVSVDKKNIVCSVSSRFRPDEVQQLLADTGQPMPRLESQNGINFIIFPRYD